ncbi:MAG: hypothetical protein KDD10_28915 [Phaeodactylibacter sp.]|nr:hypothetical protein [Phaeodactylibacter sp.]MCB9294578.1 hypothetical protein [Lewinellaceae bacterium]
MKIVLYDISNPEGIDLKSFDPKDSYCIEIEIYVKILIDNNEGVELFSTMVGNLQGFNDFFHKDISQSKSNTLFYNPRVILCKEYNYQEIFSLISNYIQGLKPKNIAELFLLMTRKFEYVDSLFHDPLEEFKYYLRMTKP